MENSRGASALSPSYRIALGGVISSLSIFAMFLTGVLPSFYLALPMLAGGLLLVIVADIGIKWGFVTYAAISLLSIIITPDKEAALMFIIFYGYYPSLKPIIERLKCKLLRLPVKLLVFNAAMVLDYKITVFVLGVDELMKELAEYGKYALPILLIVLNITFIAYDALLRGYMSLYKNYFKPRFLRKN